LKQEEISRSGSKTNSVRVRLFRDVGFESYSMHVNPSRRWRQKRKDSTTFGPNMIPISIIEKRRMGK